mgnify:CR=1 FL=1
MKVYIDCPVTVRFMMRLQKDNKGVCTMKTEIMIADVAAIVGVWRRFREHINRTL